MRKSSGAITFLALTMCLGSLAISPALMAADKDHLAWIKTTSSVDLSQIYHEATAPAIQSSDGIERRPQHVTLQFCQDSGYPDDRPKNKNVMCYDNSPEYLTVSGMSPNDRRSFVRYWAYCVVKVVGKKNKNNEPPVVISDRQIDASECGNPMQLSN